MWDVRGKGLARIVEKVRVRRSEVRQHHHGAKRYDPEKPKRLRGHLYISRRHDTLIATRCSATHAAAPTRIDYTECFRFVTAHRRPGARAGAAVHADDEHYVRYDGSNGTGIMADMVETVTLWRPVGPQELELIEKAAMRSFPPRLPEQPIFYPVLSEEYAIKIARDWNVPASGAGFVTRFEVKRDFLARYEVREAGGQAHLEYWIPAEDLAAFNEAIVGQIEVVLEFR